MTVAPAATIIFLVFMLFFIGLQPLSYVQMEGNLTGGGDALRQVAYTLVLGATIFVSGGLQKPTKLFVLPFSLVLVLGWFWFSLLWSVEPSISFRRLALTTMIIFTVFLGIRGAGMERTVAVVRIALLVALVFNYLAVALTPQAIHRAAEVGDPGLVGDWRGILAHKNFTGPLCAVTVIFYMYGPGQMSRLFRWGVVLAAAFFLYNTGSKTSQGILLMALMVGGLYHFYNPKYRALIIPVMLVVISFVLIVGQQYIPALLEPYTRQDALTGRVQIWPVLIRYAQDNWLLGSGYGAFWNVGSASPIYMYSKSWVISLANGHNGYLDLLVTVGVPGLLLAINAVFVTPVAKVLASRSLSSDVGAFLLALLIFCIGHNITESTLFDRDMLVQVFLMVGIALVSVATSPERSGKVGANTGAIHRKRRLAGPETAQTQTRGAA